MSGQWMGRFTEKPRRKQILILSLVSNLAILFFFKYFNFFNTSFSHLFSFFDISWGVPNFSVYALYVSFFPQLVAGPIERSTSLLPQFHRDNRPSYPQIVMGLQLMLWGFFKKLVIADRAAPLVNQVYNNVGDYAGPAFVIATLLFAFQIFCDFSGYSDIAIGAAQVLGFQLMTNFRSPYYSQSIREFWGRWHISLSTWFRDYVYIPLGGSKVFRFRHLFNLFVTFLVSGLWHGANWTFVIWGALHGIFLIVGEMTGKWCKNLADRWIPKRLETGRMVFNTFFTFGLVTVAWVFFRANSLVDAITIFSQLKVATFSSFLDLGQVKILLKSIGFNRSDLWIIPGALLILELGHFLQRFGSVRERINKYPVFFRWGLSYALIICVVFFGAFNSGAAFIYFQF